MKKGIFILLGMLLMVSTIEAKKSQNTANNFSFTYAYNNAVNFIENGVEFFIFTNGDFDFDTRTNDRRVRIHRDFNGRIRSIGNVHLRYDLRGNVTRIGAISIRYFRGRLTNVGDLRVRYNRWEYPVFYGNVRNFYYNNGVRFNVSFGDICNYNDTYFFRNDFSRNYTQIREDRNFYYYQANPNARIGKRSTILKRRKPISVNNNNNRRKNSATSSNNSYRKPQRTTNTRNTAIKRSTRNSNTTSKTDADRTPAIKTERETLKERRSFKKSTRNEAKTLESTRNKYEVKTKSRRNTRNKSDRS
ncbi:MULTISPECIES: hypothetical protein [unclassified Polaribacter]|uniref:hypothetical protein n=1 Tax=unclassified Polaribacter TaxID=196858 RepID=UPI0011BE7D96|nr:MULTISPECIES: hypothetical protein [unclassified Polaribacter]TXD51469.1 hypothetical protein ES043_11790 [Polaribacter sp. IC063]TXD61803.1 hypothetical protein ES044_03530 [Polaribacter sp. IC066]